MQAEHFCIWRFCCVRDVSRTVFNETVPPKGARAFRNLAGGPQQAVVGSSQTLLGGSSGRNIGQHVVKKAMQPGIVVQ
jgi:hypothetical protein